MAVRKLIKKKLGQIKIFFQLRFSRKMKIAVCLHLFYVDMFDDVAAYLKNLKYPYQLYVSLTEEYYDEEIKAKIRAFKPDAKIFVGENRGVDIGGFFRVFQHLDSDTELILKLHTKKGIGSPETPSASVMKVGIEKRIASSRIWFHDLMKGVLSDRGRVDRILATFKRDPQCGMVGYKLFQDLTVNEQEIKKLFSLFHLNEDFLGKDFIGGTMFWVRYSIIKKYFTSSTIDYLISRTEKGYRNEPSIMHAVERIFGYLVARENQKVCVIK
jgi:lipopolysaccharide biosynthesis protein